MVEQKLDPYNGQIDRLHALYTELQYSLYKINNGIDNNERQTLTALWKIHHRAGDILQDIIWNCRWESGD